MEPAALLDRLTAEGRLVLAATRRAGWDAAVPGLRWDVRTVVTHLGAVHRWSADIVRRALPTNATGGSRAFRPARLVDADRAEWFEQGLVDVVDVLRSAPEDLRCFTFLDDVPARHFWIRRQAHETAIHRADVELAAGGPVTATSPSFAQDGLTEMLAGFATERGFATGRQGRLLIAATDGPCWLVTFGGERSVTTADVPDDHPADACVQGTSDQLYRWAWNRPVPGAVESGDPDTLACWRAVRI